MKQGTALLLLTITILLAMAGGAFLYQRAFEKERLYFRLRKVILNCKSESGMNKITLDPFIDVYNADSVLVKNDVEPNDLFVGTDTINSVVIKEFTGVDWKDVSLEVTTTFNEIDAGSGQKTRRIMNLNQWKEKYNRYPQSTLLKSNILTFDLPSDSIVTAVSIQVELSSGAILTDTCR